MALKITCPHCAHPVRLEEPYPLPGAERQCECGRALSISYPMGMMEALRRKGARFAADEEDETLAQRPSVPAPEADSYQAAGRTPIMSGGGLRQRSPPSPGVPPPPPPPNLRTTIPMTSGAHRPAAPVSSPVETNLRKTLPMPEGGLRARAADLADPPTVRERFDPAPIDKTELGVRRGAEEPVEAAFDEPARTEPKLSRSPAASTPPRPPPPLTTGKGKKKKPRRGGWFWKFTAGSFGMTTMGVLVAVAAVVGVFWHHSRDLPTLEALALYRPPTVTVVYDEKHRLLGEIYEKRRYVVPLSAMPPHVLQAFIAAEDASFYEHDGVDYMGIVRAVGRNLAKGKKAQGASTITQQVARNFLLTTEKTYARKIKEVLLAWRIEEAFDKEHILHLYLNQIYLGSGAYGVEAAARVYFGKHVEELTIAEAAMIAGLPQRPSDYSPHRHFEKAKARQAYALGQMVDNGFITQAQADAATAEKLVIVERTNEFLIKAPWFTEHIRRYLMDTYGGDRVLNEGLVVESTCDLDLQQEAQRAVTEGVTGTDEKVGWRGAAETLAEEAIAPRLAELATKMDGLVEGERYEGVVLEVARKHAVVGAGEDKVIIPLSWTEWAYKPDPARNSKYRKQDDLTRALKRGDVVKVEIVNRSFRDAKAFEGYTDAGEGPFAAATLYQSPEIQGALWSYRLTDGAVIAMVGGVDYKETTFNRAVQASRQVGSTFKPIVYAAAIESKRFSTGTIVQDAPIVFNTLKSQLWKPENYGEDYLGDITLRQALAMSRNVVTIRVLDVIGIDPVLQMARRLGIESPLEPDLSMGLGSGSLKMPELARAYSAFATLGNKIEPHYINRVIDRDDQVLEEWKQPEWERVMDANAAGVMGWLLQEVATSGTAAKAQKLGLHVGGKTGTTNDYHDAWFVGFTPDVLTAVWVGYDQPKSLGSSATGGYTALPIWMDYMADAAPKAQDRPFPSPGGLVWMSIDEKTGRPMQGGRSMPFLPGTAPSGAVVAAGQKTSEDLLNE